MNTRIDTAALGLMVAADQPKTKNNRHRNKWRIRFDTGIEMLVPPAILEVMQFHLPENDPPPPGDQS